MILFHTADLHIGKILSYHNLIDDQKHILRQILEHIKMQSPAALLISGDIYDKPIPSEDAVRLFGSFLTEVVSLNCKVFMIGGNHDSAARLDFASKILSQCGVYTYGSCGGGIRAVNLSEYVVVHMLPFVNFSSGGDEVLAQILKAHPLDKDKNNILLVHQFISFRGNFHKDIDMAMAGGIDIVNGSLFSEYSYVAAGHLHRPQQEGNVRYSGSPLKYSKSEVLHSKSLTKITIGADKSILIEELPLAPLRDMRKISGPLNELLKAEESEGKYDYIYAELTDIDSYAAVRLKKIYPNLVETTIVNVEKTAFSISMDMEKKDSAELFEEFFQLQNGKPPTDRQRKIWKELTRS